MKVNGRFFKVDMEKCVNCGLCVKSCPEENVKIVDGKYVVLIPRNINDNNKFGYKLYKYVRVKYSSTYNKDNVLQESVNTRTGLQNFLDDKVKEELKS